MLWRLHTNRAVEILINGGIISYPTEGVYGLGCHIHSQPAIERLIALKRRPKSSGLVVVGCSYQQLTPLMGPLSDEEWRRLTTFWPGPTTMLVPVAADVSELITGGRPSVALRLSNHPVIVAICQHLGEPIISTSANFHGQEPARTAKEINQQFGSAIDFVMPGPLGNLGGPTEIRDLKTNEIIRRR